MTQSTFSNFAQSMAQSIQANNELLGETAKALTMAGEASAQGCIYALFLTNGKSEANFSSGVVQFHKLYPDFKVLGLKDFKDIKNTLLLKGLAPRTIDNYKSRFNKLLSALDKGIIKANDACKLSHAGIAELITGTPKVPTAKVYNVETIVIKGVSVDILAKALGLEPKAVASALTSLAEIALHGEAVEVAAVEVAAVEVAAVEVAAVEVAAPAKKAKAVAKKAA